VKGMTFSEPELHQNVILLLGLKISGFKPGQAIIETS
jgi:hypothetical protein